jgi:hypothetical protein
MFLPVSLRVWLHIHQEGECGNGCFFSYGLALRSRHGAIDSSVAFVPGIQWAMPLGVISGLIPDNCMSD